MTALAARFFPNASAKSVAEFGTLASVALFCGIGLLMSVSRQVHPGRAVLRRDVVRAFTGENRVTNFEHGDGVVGNVDAMVDRLPCAH
jgi:hypothetical protein